MFVGRRVWVLSSTVRRSFRTRRSQTSLLKHQLPQTAGARFFATKDTTSVGFDKIEDDKKEEVEQEQAPVFVDDIEGLRDVRQYAKLVAKRNEKYEDVKRYTQVMLEKKPVDDPDVLINQVEKTIDGRAKLAPHVYTFNGTVTSHTAEDVGKVYSIGEEGVLKVPDVLNIPMDEELRFSYNYMMIREEPWRLVQRLKEQDSDIFGKTIGIAGRRGCGKSGALHYVTQFAVENDWLVVPTRGEEFGADYYGHITPSPENPGVYDQARMTSTWFKTMRDTNRAALEKIVLKRPYLDYNWDFYPESDWYAPALAPPIFPIQTPPSPTNDSYERTLYDLVCLAAADIEQSARILSDFVEEIKLPTEVPVLVVVDNVNAWDHLSQYYDMETVKPLESKRLGLVHALFPFIKQGPANGITLFASGSHCTSREIRHYYRGADEVVEMKPYTDPELMTIIDHYLAAKCLSEAREEITPTWRGWFKGITGGVPRDVSDVAFSH